MAPLTKTLVNLFLLSALAAASPLQGRSETVSSECDSPDLGHGNIGTGSGSNTGNGSGTPAAKYGESFPEEINYIYPNYKDMEKKADGVHLESFRGESQIEQVSVYKVPANARNCHIDYRYQSKLERLFVVRTAQGPNGVLDSSCMSDLRVVPEVRRPVTYASMESMFDVSRPYDAMNEWALWDLAQYTVDLPGNFTPEAKVSGRAIPCKEEVVIWERLRNVTAEKTVYLQTRDRKAGWFINYDLV